MTRVFVSALSLVLTLAALVPAAAQTSPFDPYQATGYQAWCHPFNPYDLLPGQPAPDDRTLYDESRCATIDMIDQETVTKLSLPEAVVWAPGSEYAWLVVHQTDRAQVQNVLVQIDGFNVPIRHFYQLLNSTRRLAVALHDLPELRGHLTTFSVLVSCGGGCSAQISMRDAAGIWPHPTIINGQTVTIPPSTR